MPLFNFKLRPIAEIAPWGAPEAPSLSWFGLSDGWFWLALGGQEVLRSRETPANGTPPFVDYQVVRLWEDVVEWLPAVLEPVPRDVVAALRDADRWYDEVQSDPTEHGWWFARQLDFGYLVKAPSVHAWCERDVMHFRWRSHPQDADLWGQVRGEAEMSVHEFVEEAREFNDSFLSAMGERVGEVVRAGGLPGIVIDLDRLQEEQRDRSTWFRSALARSALTET